MNKRIQDKIDEIERYLSELEEIKPTTFEEYIQDIKSKAACERYAEKITECMVDLAYLLIKDYGLRLPERDTQAFDILAANNLISQELCSKLQDAKGMRNILAHKYGEVDDAIIFHAIHEELVVDCRKFINAIISEKK